MSSLKLYDLIPKPIQAIFSKFGLDDRFFHSLYTLTFKPDSLSNDDKKFSRPFEFLSASILLVSAISISISIPINSITELEKKLLSEYLPVLIVLYLITLVISFFSMHIDMICFGYFHDKVKEKISYKDRIVGVSYMQGWGLIVVAPFLPLAIFVENTIYIDGFFKFYGLLCSWFQINMAANLLNMNVRKFVKFQKNLMKVLFIPIFIAVIITVYHSF